MRKKIIIAVCMGMVLLMAAALLYIRLMGGGGAQELTMNQKRMSVGIAMYW